MPKARSPRPGDPTEAAPQPNALAFAAADPPPPALDAIDAVVAASSASTRDLNAALRDALAPDLDQLDRKRATTAKRRDRARRAANAKRGKAETAALDAIAASLGHDPADPQPWKPCTSTGDAGSATLIGQPNDGAAVEIGAGERGSLGGGTIPPPPPLDSGLREGGRGSKRRPKAPVDLTTPPPLPPAPTDMTYAAPMRRRLRAVCCLRLLGQRSWERTVQSTAAEAEAVLYARDAPEWARACWRAWRADLSRMPWAGRWAFARRDGVEAPVSRHTIRRHLRRWPAPAAS